MKHEHDFQVEMIQTAISTELTYEFPPQRRKERWQRQIVTEFLQCGRCNKEKTQQTFRWVQLSESGDIIKVKESIHHKHESRMSGVA